MGHLTLLFDVSSHWGWLNWLRWLSGKFWVVGKIGVDGVVGMDGVVGVVTPVNGE